MPNPLKHAIQTAIFWGFIGLGRSIAAVSEAASAITDALCGLEEPPRRP